MIISLLKIGLFRLINFLKIKDLDISEDNARINSHKVTLENKPVMQELFQKIEEYTHTLAIKYALTNSKHVLEIGSGVHPFLHNNRFVISSDIVFNSDLDLVVDAQKLCFRDESFWLILGQFVFHHFPNPELTISELQRVLTPGGVIIFIEPANTFLGKKLFPIIHKSEYYDPTAGWENKARGAMENANQALSYIYFNRDRSIFMKKFPNLEILEDSLLLPFGLRYISSGGLNFRQLLPDFLFGNILKFLDRKFDFFAVHWAVVLRKK